MKTPNQQTVQELLQKSGYETAMIKKWHWAGQPTHLLT
jgi:arylsulfatase A-like enzyme